MAILVVGNVVVLSHLSETSQKLEKQHSMTVETKSQLKKLTKEKKEVDSSLRDKIAETTSLKEENEGLKANLQAKREAQAAAITVAQTQQLTQRKQNTAVAVSGTCDDWLASAGVSDLNSARTLISRESGCNPNAVNPSSGACGVAQELPCGKSGCSLGDGACQVGWMNGYVHSRYGSWANALGHSYRHNWY